MNIVSVSPSPVANSVEDLTIEREEGEKISQAEIPLYAVVDKTRTYQESPQKAIEETICNVEVTDVVIGRSNEDLSSLYATVNIINPNRICTQILDDESDMKDNTDRIITQGTIAESSISSVEDKKEVKYEKLMSPRCIILVIIAQMVMITIIFVISLAFSIKTFNNTQNLNSEISQFINGYKNTLSSFEKVNLPPSCADLLRIDSSAPSGLYWIRSSSGMGVQVYCDMTMTCGDITGGWMRVASIVAGEDRNSCPCGLKWSELDTGYYFCITDTTERRVIFQVNNTRYSRVCASVTAYQNGSGISLHVNSARRSSKQDIWVFTARNTSEFQSRCPCRSSFLPLLYDYTCDKRCPISSGKESGYYCPVDKRCPISSGEESGYYCPVDERCCHSCCSNKGTPTFFKHLVQPTTDDIEIRVMHEGVLFGSVFIEQINIYIYN